MTGLIRFFDCLDCNLFTLDGDAARDHRDETGHRITSGRLDRHAGEGHCAKHLHWPCPCAVPIVLDETSATPVRRVGTALADGHVLCERHSAERADWSGLDPSSDTAKRLVRPGINLVQIGSPTTQLKYGESYIDAFRRIVDGQIAVVDDICRKGTACRNLVAPPAVDPRQHCTSQVCPIGWYEHRATRCQEIQPERCPCCTELYAEPRAIEAEMETEG